MNQLDAAECKYYDEDTIEALKEYAEALTASSNGLGALITMELNTVLEPNQNIFRSHPEIYKQRAKVLKPHLKPKILPARLVWENGLVTSTNVGSHIKKQNKWLEVLLSNRAGRAIRKIHFSHSKDTCNYKRALQTLVEKETPNLRELDVSQRGSTGFDGLRGLHQSAPRLEVLRLTGKMNPGSFKTLGTTWPNLHTLEVDFDMTPVWLKPQSGKKFAKLFIEGALPKIRNLRIDRTGMDDSLLDLIAKSGVLANLDSLHLGGFFTADAISSFILQLPQTCRHLITQYSAQTDHQSVEKIYHGGILPKQNAEYDSLWKPLQETDWWEDNTPFDGASLEIKPRGSSKVSSVLSDGRRHGRQSEWQVRNREVIWRYDTMYWFGVQHGAAWLKSKGKIEHRRFINGLRDDTNETFSEDGTLIKRSVYSQGVLIEDYNKPLQEFHAKEEELFNRFGKEFTTEKNPRYTVGIGKPLDPKIESIPQIAQNLTRTDNGMKIHDLTFEDGELAQVVLWTAGDTTCGVILDGNQVVGLIEDLEIRLPGK